MLLPMQQQHCGSHSSQLSILPVPYTEQGSMPQLAALAINDVKTEIPPAPSDLSEALHFKAFVNTP
jgi:hypothetical protein